MKKIVILVTVLVMTSVSSPMVRAQRQMDGQSSVQVDCFMAAQAGAEATWNIYYMLGHLRLGVGYLFCELPDFIDASDYIVTGGYLFRIVSTRSRNVVLSGGVMGDIGIRNYSYYKSPDTDVKYPQNHIGYSVSPTLELEAFPFKNLSFVVTGAPKLYFNRSDYGCDRFITPMFSFGLNFYI